MAETSQGAQHGLPPFLLVRNLARDPASRAARKLRPGNSLGFILGDGRRIRRAGGRPTQLSMKEVVEHAEALAEGVKYRYIEITTPDGKVVPEEALLMFAGRTDLAEEAKKGAVMRELDRVKHALQNATPETWDDLVEEFMDLAKESGMDRADAETLMMSAKDQVAMRHAPKTQVISDEKFTVMLMDAGENKVLAARELRNVTGLSLSDVQHLMETVPKPIKEGATASEAQEMKAVLEKTGASVQVVPETSPLSAPAGLPPPDFEPDLGAAKPEPEPTKIERTSKKPGRR